jgi:lipopolysaccharide/colanic/teichoic acid biosynthesis glycosyltransferase
VDMLAPKPMSQHANGASRRSASVSQQHDLLSAPVFRKMLSLEQRRCARSGRRFVLMLLDWTSLVNGGTTADLRDNVLTTLTRSIRDTDVAGWYEDESIFGVIFTELGEATNQAVSSALLTRVTQALSSSLGIDQIRKIVLSFHVYPEGTSAENGGNSSSGKSLTEEDPPRLSKMVKRAIDISGGLFLILCGSPLLLTVALAVKLTSSGPVLFRQIRIGRNGRPFTFLKFRSMYNGNDPRVHQEFVTRLIQGDLSPETTQFKIVADPRVTRIGRFLRRTSLDELPQLFNVVRGDMSLVGPRPPVPYEVECYKTWHQRRLTDIRPGITGLWQVTGRSRVGFDDMVRLDLRYARAWSLWLDLKIMLETPRAVVSGNGAH